MFSRKRCFQSTSPIGCSRQIPARSGPKPVERPAAAFYTAAAMGDMAKSLYYRLTSEAYDLPAVIVELLLIGLCVNWCASVLQGTRGHAALARCA